MGQLRLPQPLCCFPDICVIHPLPTSEMPPSRDNLTTLDLVCVPLSFSCATRRYSALRFSPSLSLSLCLSVSLSLSLCLSLCLSVFAWFSLSPAHRKNAVSFCLPHVRYAGK